MKDKMIQVKKHNNEVYIKCDKLAEELEIFNAVKKAIGGEECGLSKVTIEYDGILYYLFEGSTIDELKQDFENAKRFKLERFVKSNDLINKLNEYAKTSRVDLSKPSAKQDAVKTALYVMKEIAALYDEFGPENDSKDFDVVGDFTFSEYNLGELSNALRHIGFVSVHEAHQKFLDRDRLSLNNPDESKGSVAFPIIIFSPLVSLNDDERGMVDSRLKHAFSGGKKSFANCWIDAQYDEVLKKD